MASMITVGELFAGIGGIGKGLEDTGGFQVKWQCENDKYATRVLEKHWPNVTRHSDVRTFPPPAQSPWLMHDWKATWGVDMVVGGDPCQANSAAAGPSPSKAKSLGGEFVRVVDAIRPRLVLRENPSNVRKDAPWPWWRMRAALESLGYAVVPFRLRACCVGGDQQRERLFLFGELANANGNRLEGWNDENTPAMQSQAIPAPLGPADWPNIPAARGYRSRTGLPTYVDRVRCLGNAVVPQVAYYIGQQILNAEKSSKHFPGVGVVQ